METDPAKDSGSESSGSVGVPTPQISQNSSDQPSSSATPFNEDALIEKLTTRLEDVVERKLQSTKDKRFKNLEGYEEAAPTLKKFKEYLDKSGGDVDKASREMQIDQLIASRGGGGSPAPTGAQRSETVDETKVADILNEAGVKFDDPDVVAWGKKTYASAGDAYHSLTRLATRKLKQAAPGNPAGAVFDGVGNSPSTNKEERKNELYAELAATQSNPDAHEKRRKEIKAELAKLG